MACANEQEYERRPQDRSPLCRRCSAGSETFCPQVDEAPHVLAGPRHAAPPATCEPLVGSRSWLLAYAVESSRVQVCISTLENMYAAIRQCGIFQAPVGINSQTSRLTDASCKLRHKYALVMHAGRPHRTNCHPLIIHLAPEDAVCCAADQLPKRPATQNRTKRRPARINPLPLPLQRSAVSRVHTKASTRSSHHGTCPMIRANCQCAVPCPRRATTRRR